MTSKILILSQRQKTLEKIEREMFSQAIQCPPERLEFVNFFDPSWQSFDFSLDRFSHIFMLGSSHNISYGELDWFATAKKVIWEAAERRIPFLGICFGMQFLCYSFGAKLIEDKTNREGGKIQVYTQNTTKTFFEFLPSSFYTNAFHTDFVEELPAEFMNLGYSDKCPVHIVAHRQLPLFGVQFHPEHTKDYISRVLKHYSAAEIAKYTIQDPEAIVGQIVEHNKLQDSVSELWPRFLSL